MRSSSHPVTHYQSYCFNQMSDLFDICKDYLKKNDDALLPNVSAILNMAKTLIHQDLCQETEIRTIEFLLLEARLFRVQKALSEAEASCRKIIILCAKLPSIYHLASLQYLSETHSLLGQINLRTHPEEAKLEYKLSIQYKKSADAILLNQEKETKTDKSIAEDKSNFAYSNVRIISIQGSKFLPDSLNKEKNIKNYKAEMKRQAHLSSSILPPEDTFNQIVQAFMEADTAEVIPHKKIIDLCVLALNVIEKQKPTNTFYLQILYKQLLIHYSAICDNKNSQKISKKLSHYHRRYLLLIHC